MSAPNGVMMQYFHWYNEPDGTLWDELADKAEALAAAGITSVWLPPAYKGTAGGYDVGYGVYDMYDLGEFDQKGSIRTKYGTKDEYINAIKTAKQAGIQVYADVVLNHRLGGDAEEEFRATPYSPSNRQQPIGDEVTIKSWTHFNFPGRQGKYSALELHWWHFNAADYNAYEQGDFEAIFLFEGKTFDTEVDMEKGGFDYLMGCDVDFNHPEIRDDMMRWGEWIVDTTDVDGFRFDAVKHVQAGFFPDWLQNTRRYSGRRLFAVGEYWSSHIEALHHFIDVTGGDVALFDAPLHYNFTEASKTGNNYDMRTIFDGTLVKDQPTLAVTLVENHDSQPLQSLESVVEPWFKPLAYALILMRRDGYPCVFYADYYGAHYKDSGKDGNEYEIWMDSHQWLIDKFLQARQKYAYGDQYDYFDHANTIGWTRLGTDEFPGGLAVVLSTGEEGTKWMEVGRPNTTYVDLTEHIDEPITTNEDGWANFRCLAGSVSVWIPQES
ncbi:Alpha amylase, catalytic domain subfamily [Synechococcus sp. PCC 7335]|uniref:alpha-amylase n=1 Tax=Synechococcus sp. (strain ATCC 29403 / PCC 7335) TaxID=91464 RepID=UPI00017EB89F|nr:alpha-amylase [Synechococcus sp. PCC 7335]EDX86325.1 Alpha amylase, catalytic domain subfamily [Synechococcus sp. PCC 7335]